MEASMNFSKRAIIQCTGRESGFSLIELMVAIGVLSILAGIATPGFINWLPDYRLKSAARDLYSNFQLARITAIKSGTHCTITFNQPVDDVTYDYVVFKDADNDLEYDTSEKPGIITKVKWTDYKSVSGNSNTFTNNDDGLPAIAFRSNGIPSNNTGGLGMGTLSIKNTKNKETDIVVSSAGNIRID